MNIKNPFVRACVCSMISMLGGCTGYIEATPSAPGAVGGGASAGLGGSGVGGGSSGGGSTSQPPAGGVQAEARPQVFLLTYRELRNALADLVSGSQLKPLDVQPDRMAAGYVTAGASDNGLSSVGVEQWESTASKLLAPLFDDAARRREWLGCEPSGFDDPCVTKYLREFGAKAWRRPLTEPEVGRYLQVARETGAALPDQVREGMRYATLALLQSPNFLYRIYLGEPDPQRPGHRRLSAHEVASKLAFSLTQSPPDAALREAASSAKLDDRATLEAQARRLLATPRSVETRTQFCRELFSLGPLLSTTRSETVIAALPGSLLGAMEDEALQFCVRGLSSSDARSVLRADATKLTPELARLYGVAGAVGGALSPLPDVHRAGVLTSAGFLTVMAHEDRTSPTLRGRFIRERLLCQAVPDPPPNVATDLPDAAVAQPMSLRDRLNRHRDDPACAACHELMDPLGFGLEQFDSVGRFRKEDAGSAVDASGSLDGAAFDGALGLTDAVVRHPDLPRCLATQWFRFAEARLETGADAPELARLGADLVASRFDFSELVVQLSVTPAFRSLGEVTP